MNETPHETRSASERADAAPRDVSLQWNDSPTGVAEALLIDPRDGSTFAAVLREHALRLTESIIAGAATLAPNLIAWSGSLADEPFARDPRTWGPAGLAAFREAAARLAPILRARNVTLLLRPHARHILCDPQRCLMFEHEWRERNEPFGLALDAAAMIEESMMGDAEDHVRRAMEALAPWATVTLGSDASPARPIAPAARGARLQAVARIGSTNPA